ncbi:hypothetical protein AA0111_g7907 [Alternaria arborescens]|uniref:hypothetical protein n=1 Tax=Alternaria arborescens TaxID=156630 RepID=UPI001074A948|nr:hypothetical protein AA0111_g7907 [Alternaria arborescens]RYO26636.1 hypothetical protein AA0111_g7907 [Alternaria arborescens]
MTSVGGCQSHSKPPTSMREFDELYPSPQDIESQKWSNALENSQRALKESMHSPAYRRLSTNTASIWNIDIPGLQDSSGGTAGNGGDRGVVQSPLTDTRVKLSNSYKGRHNGYVQASVPKPASIVPEGSFDRDLNTTGLATPLSHRSHTLLRISTESPRQPYFGGSDHAYAKLATFSTSSGWLHKQEKHSQRPLRSTAHSSALGLQDDPHPANLSNPRGSPRTLHTPDRSDFYDRMEGDWISGLSGIPSPSRPGSTGKQLHETNGIPLCSVPNGTILRDYEMAWRRSAEHGTDMKRSKHRQRGPSSPTVQRYASTGSILPAFDITPRSAQIDDEGNIFINGPGHVRKHTDPFVDSKLVLYGSQSARFPIARPSTQFQLPSQPSMRRTLTPTTALCPKSAPKNVPSAHPPTLVTLPVSATSVRAMPPTPAFFSSVSGPVTQDRPPTRSTSLILPPPLSSIQGKYHHTPEARARLKAQEPVREKWIRTEAAKIGQLARLRQNTYRRWVETNSELNYRNWQKAEAALAEATNTENKKEERRNLFLNLKGMTALKTDKAEDMSADSRDRDTRGGEEKLLGYQMATMERVCAEVKHGEGDAIITAEMLATLSLDEKKALRKHLLGRLGRY